MNMTVQGFDTYMPRDPEMNAYLYAHGWHFTEKMAMYAAGLMEKKKPGEKEPTRIKPYDTKKVDEILELNGVMVENKDRTLYDYVYAANWCQAEFLESSVPDEQHMAKFVKDMVDDADAPDGMLMSMWYGKMNRAGIPIPWLRML